MNKKENTGIWDVEDFRNFVNSYGDLFVIFASKYTSDMALAEDVVQDCLSRIWLEKSKQREVDIVNAPAYALSMIRNIALNNRRKTKRWVLTDTFDADSSSTNDLLDTLMQNEKTESILKTLDCLPAHWAKVIRLSLLGYSNEEIAQEMDTTIDGIKAIKQRAIQKLKTLLPPTLMWITIFVQKSIGW